MWNSFDTRGQYYRITISLQFFKVLLDVMHFDMQDFITNWNSVHKIEYLYPIHSVTIHFFKSKLCHLNPNDVIL